MLKEPDFNGDVTKNFFVRGGPGKDGRLLVEIQWPLEKAGRVFDRDEALAVGLMLVDVASKLYSSAAEFGRAINWARSIYLHQEPVTFPPPGDADAPENHAQL